MEVPAELIPGLPDELAQECLIRLHYTSLPSARAVTKLWRRDLDSPCHHHLRRSRRLSRPLLLLAQSDPPPSSSPAHKYSSSVPHSYRLSLHDPRTALWSSLPPIPSLPHGLPIFCRLAAAARDLAVVGGWDPDTWTPSPDVHIYSFTTGAWRRGSPMPGPRRSFFACAAAATAEGAAVLVAGGHDEEKNALRSALAYNVARDEWAPLPDMAEERDECHGVFLRGGGGKFRVVGGYPTEAQGRFSGSAEAFDVATWTWGPVEEEGAVEAAGGACTGPCAAAGGGGRMYACSRGKVAVLEEGAGWRHVADVPADVVVAAQIGGWEGSLMVIGSGSHGGALAAYVLKLGQEKVQMWQRVEVPLEYSGHVQAVCCLEI